MTENATGDNRAVTGADRISDRDGRKQDDTGTETPTPTGGVWPKSDPTTSTSRDGQKHDDTGTETPTPTGGVWPKSDPTTVEGDLA